MSDIQMGIDLDDGQFFVSPETLRDLANRLEAGEHPQIKVTEFASDIFMAQFHTMKPGEFDESDYEDEDDD